MPETYELIAQARKVLAELYTDPASARGVAHSAGLPLSQIAFSNQAPSHRQAILEEAQKQGRVLAVLDAALQDYKVHPELPARAGWAGREKTSVAHPPGSQTIPRELATLRRQLGSARDNLALIEERKAEYVLEVDVPLQLVREERRLRERIADLERRIAEFGM